MSVLGGGLLGFLTGVVLWLAARYLMARCARVRVEAGPLVSDGQPDRVREATPVIAAITLAAMALWGAYLGWRAPTLEQFAPALAITGVLATVTLVDFRVRRIPNVLVTALLLWALVQVLWLEQPTLGSAALGLAAGAALFGLVYVARRGAMGLGDVKLAAALGAVLGFPLILSGLLYGAVAGGAAALFLLVTHRVGRKDYMAYGPYLSLGGWFVAMGSLGLW